MFLLNYLLLLSGCHNHRDEDIVVFKKLILIIAKCLDNLYTKFTREFIQFTAHDENKRAILCMALSNSAIAKQYTISRENCTFRTFDNAT